MGDDVYYVVFEPDEWPVPTCGIPDSCEVLDSPPGGKPYKYDTREEAGRRLTEKVREAWEQRQKGREA